MHAPQLGIGDRGVDHDDGACARAKRYERIESGSILGAVGRRLDDDVAAGADALLKGVIIVDRGVARTQGRARINLVLRPVDMVMAVAGIGRRLELWGLGPRRILDLLCRCRPRARAEHPCPRQCREAPQHVAPIPAGLPHRLLHYSSLTIPDSGWV